MNEIQQNFTITVASLVFAAVISGLPAQASDVTESNALVEKAQTTINAFANNKDFPGLKSALGQAKGVLIFPQILKAGFILGGSGGSGVLLVRDEKTGNWIGPAFYTMGSASLGFQAGASAAEVVMLVHSQKALDSLYSNKLKLGADASVAVGPKGLGTGASITADFITYSTVKGAFVGMAVDGSVLDVRDSLNAAYYGKSVTPMDILVKQDVSNNLASAGLQAALKKASK
ncbi:MAG: lipid-binding SYLF domain-containing protein [Undibacterium sp.]|uniref:lipid-binding SYLF domain-containing protein n=1 Tax=Undibacterium sp. TaxID=1914977 RepID=UPI00271C6656|nr:lipid-binding SYLF domain-containing protein [Undibacterium sp.]MDO8652783.1 lipid-binding SYLF domain-containing protein [Undibacterium sp.]